MSKMNEHENNLLKKKDGSIKNIVSTVKNGMRMSPAQLRLSLAVVGVLLAVLVLLIISAGGWRSGANAGNQQASVLRDSISAERIGVGEGNVISFDDAYTYSGTGPRYILTTQISTTKNYWATVRSDSEIAAFEEKIGAGRFLRIADLGGKSLWLVMGPDADIRSCSDSGFHQLYTTNDTEWLKTGTDEENRKAEEAWDNIRFIRFEELGETKVRLRRGTDETLKNLESTKTLYRVLTIIAVVALLVVIFIFGYLVKPRGTLEHQVTSRKRTRIIFLGIIVILTAAVVLMAYQTDKAQDETARMEATIAAVDRDEVAAAEADVVVIEELAAEAQEKAEAAEAKAKEARELAADGGEKQIAKAEEAEEAAREARAAAEDAEAAVGKARDAVEEARKEMARKEQDASGEKFSYTNSNGVKATVTILRESSSVSLHRIIKAVAIILVFAVLVAALYWLRYEQDLAFPIANTVILIVLMIITLYPVINTVAYSFNEGTDALRGGIGLWPRVFSVKSYTTLLTAEVGRAALISASKTIITTLLNLLLTGMLAYALSRREYTLRKFITTVLVLTMYVNAGMIPNYLLISRTLGLRNTFLVYIIPTMFSCFNMIVIRTYIAGLPEALVESAKIDGAGDFRAYWQIIFPLCMPVLATVALFVAVGAWNSWFDTYLYCGSEKDLYTLQYILKMKLATTQNSSNAAQTSIDALKTTTLTTPVTIRCAITVISTVPILIVYPFLQKYFVTGMALGAVKG